MPVASLRRLLQRRLPAPLAVNKGGKDEAVIDFVASDSVTKTGDCAYQLAPVIKIKTAKVDGKEFAF